MLYQKQKNNPRSPLTVIRNQIKHGLQVSSSRPVSRSPSYSPVSRNLQCVSKDYSTYIPVRSVSKGENIKPTSATANHIELKTSRKFLMNETKKLEEKVKEIKKKVENEVRNMRNSNTRKVPRSHCSLMYQKLLKIIYSRIKTQLKSAISDLKSNSKSQNFLEATSSTFYSKSLLSKSFQSLRLLSAPLASARKNKEKMAKRHYNLQLLLTTLTKWQEFLNISSLNPQDKSYIEEMDSLIQSFVQDSHTLSPKSFSSITPQKLIFSDALTGFKEPSPNRFKLIIPEKLNFDSSVLFSFRNEEVSELEIIAQDHYSNSLMVNPK